MLNKYVLPLFLMLALSACGFHLRSAVEFPAVLKQTSITGIAEFAPLRLELKRVLTNAGAQILPDSSRASATIVISNEQYRRRVLSIDAQGRAAEYALDYSFYFQLDDKSGQALVSRQRIVISRDFRFDPNAVLAKDSEEQQIRADMIRLAVHQLIRRVDATLKQQPE